MSINARTEEFQHIELFDKYALFTNARIDRSTVPEGWYCYDFRGSDSDPGKLNYVELRVGVNHSGAVLLPEKLDMKGKDYRRVRGQINFLGSQMTLREFCEAHQLPYPEEKEQFHIRPARPDEAGLFYTPHPEEDKRRGKVVHLGPAFIGRAFTLTHPLLNVDEQIDTAGRGRSPCWGRSRGSLAVNDGLYVLGAVAVPQRGCPETGRPLLPWHKE